METISKILERAKKRSEESNLPYAGALTPQEAYDILQKTQHAKLVDVRTTAELDLVGKVPEAIHIEWAFYPGMVTNPDFAKHLRAIYFCTIDNFVRGSNTSFSLAN